MLLSLVMLIGVTLLGNAVKRKRHYHTQYCGSTLSNLDVTVGHSGLYL